MSVVAKGTLHVTVLTTVHPTQVEMSTAVPVEV